MKNDDVDLKEEINAVCTDWMKVNRVGWKMVRLTLDDYAGFEPLARDGGVSAAWLMRRAMREFLECCEKGGVGELPLGVRGGGQ